MREPWRDPAIVAFCARVLASHRALLGRPLLADEPADPAAAARALYDAEDVIVAHGVEADPVFRYANRAAQALFELSWDAFTRTPSRLSAAPMDRAERDALLARARRDGCIDGFRIERVTASGRRFAIADTRLWNVSAADGTPLGQAAAYRRWSWLDAAR